MMERGQAPKAGGGSGGGSGARAEAFENSHYDADFDQDLNWEPGTPSAPDRARRIRQVAHGLGTLVSLAVIGFGGYWGYRQIMRDVHGIPVVRALEGPVRIAPEDPGGMVASNAGLSVNDVQAAGAASAPEERLMLAPASVGLEAEDLPGAELPVPQVTGNEAGNELATPAEAADAELVVDVERAVPVPAALSEEIPPDDPIARAIALATASSAGALPLSSGGEVPGRPERDGGAEDGAPPPPDLPDDGGVQLSPRPPRRPAGLTGAVASVAAPAGARAVQGEEGRPEAEPPAALEASAVPAGTRLVQLGAFDTAEDAREAWSRISARFEGLMADKTRIIAEVSTGGRSFWRLRAMGFADLSDARRFCTALIAERADCIPVVAR